MQLGGSKLIGIALALAAGVAVFVLWPKEDASPEAVIRRKVVAMCEAAEERDVAAIAGELSDRFKAANGLDKPSIKAFIAGQVLRGQWVSVVPTGLVVTLTGEGTADFSGKFVFARAAGDLAAQAQAGGLSSYQIDGRLELEDDGEWRFVWAKYRAVDARELF